ncbi:MAG: hypothetical protein ACYS6W_04230 [Planctomycetota bacterium]|jgi:hypothetical protein
MKHPIALIIPVLVLCDYYLTIVGSILCRRGYGKHIKAEQYELNPRWQSSINKRKWFNARYIILVALITLLAVFICEVGDALITGLGDFFVALLMVLFSALIGRHLSNILIFRYVIKHPEGISGETLLSQKMLLKMSQYNVLLALCPFIVVALCVRIPFILGSLSGLLLFWAIHWIWLRRHKRQLEKQIDCSRAVEPTPQNPGH